MAQLVITRPQEEGRKLANLLEKIGHACYCEPLLTIQDTPPPAPIAAQAFLDAELLLITSANGLRALYRLFPDIHHRALTCLTVGDASAALARNYGHKVESADGDVNSLIDLVKRLYPDPQQAPNFLHLAGSVEAGALTQTLQTCGYKAKRLQLYHAEPASQFSPQLLTGLHAKIFDGVVFFSPRTAKIFVSLLKQYDLENVCPNLTAYALSPAVGEALSTLLWRQCLIAPTPTQAALVTLLQTQP
jgi:uroporphyrinogen-III synthase